MAAVQKRWWIAGLIFLATLINFLNRLTVSVLAPVITKDLGLTKVQYAAIANAFLIAYTASQGLSGKLYDRIGAKRGFSLSIVVWSLASMAHAFATGLFSLQCFRFLLGLGEAGNWPGAAKVIAQWFPVRERALGMGIFNSGTSIGSVLAPPLIIWLQSRFGWQSTFLVLGGAGFGWLILWLLFYEDRTPPGRSRRSAGSRCCAIAKYGPSYWRDSAPIRSGGCTSRGCRCISTRSTASACATSARSRGCRTWRRTPAALGGGWMSGFLIARGWSVNRARKAVILGRHAVHVGRAFSRRRRAARRRPWR